MAPSTPLDDVEFLARSPNRVEVLRTLASGPRTRPDLHGETGVPQPTLGRVLGAFEERNWVERRGKEYALTPFGDLVVEAFGDLLESVETVRKLGDVLGTFPTDWIEFDFDLREFRDATVHTPDAGDALSHVRRMEELWFEADQTRLLGGTLGPASFERRREHAREYLNGDKRAETITSLAMVEQGMSDPELNRMARETLDLDRTTAHLYDGPIPVILAIADDVAMLAPTNGDGIPTAVVETTNGTVRSWVEATLDDYRERSTEITLDDLPS